MYNKRNKKFNAFRKWNLAKFVGQVGPYPTRKSLKHCRQHVSCGDPDSDAAVCGSGTQFSGTRIDHGLCSFSQEIKSKSKLSAVMSLDLKEHPMSWLQTKHMVLLIRWLEANIKNEA
ncbi:hypothetical protein YC2023_086022 [Brassica napus]